MVTLWFHFWNVPKGANMKSPLDFWNMITRACMIEKQFMILTKRLDTTRRGESWSNLRITKTLGYASMMRSLVGVQNAWESQEVTLGWRNHQFSGLWKRNGKCNENVINGIVKWNHGLRSVDWFVVFIFFETRHAFLGLHSEKWVLRVLLCKNFATWEMICIVVLSECKKQVTLCWKHQIQVHIRHRS